MGKTIELSGFPFYVTVDHVKTYVEHITGEGTVFAVKIRQSQGKDQRIFAIIQFISARNASLMMSKATKKLLFGNSRLKAREMMKDIVPNPRSSQHCLNNVKLHFGCQLSEERISVLWRNMDVRLCFGSGMRKFHFFLSHNNSEYKLELYYENIWKIELHRPRGETANYLLIQVLKSKLIIIGFNLFFRFK